MDTTTTTTTTIHRGEAEALEQGLTHQDCSGCHRQNLPIGRFFAKSRRVALCKRCDECRQKHAKADREFKRARRDLQRQRELEEDEAGREATTTSPSPAADAPAAPAVPAADTTSAKIKEETPAPDRPTTGGKAIAHLVIDDSSEDGAEDEELLSASSTATPSTDGVPYRECRLCGRLRSAFRVEHLSHGVYVCEYCKAANANEQWCIQCSREKPQIEFMDLEAEFHRICNRCRAIEATPGYN